MRPLPPLERIDYVTGCDLLRADLAGSVAYEARLLALHIATVHQTWGVGRGLAPTLSPDATAVYVTVGFGFTCRGEPIALTQRATVAAPLASGPAATMSRPLFDLILTRARGLWGPCEQPATCTGLPTPPLGPQPAIEWSLAGDAAVDPVPPLGYRALDGDAIPLGRFELQPSGTLVGPDLSQRRVARGPVRPYIGSAPPGSLNWTAGAYALTTSVDTTAAHFGTTPVYLVTLANSPWLTPTLLGPLASITGAPSATSFDLQLLFAQVVGPQPPDFLTQLAQQASQLTVSWIGLENTVNCG